MSDSEEEEVSNESAEFQSDRSNDKNNQTTSSTS